LDYPASQKRSFAPPPMHYNSVALTAFLPGSPPALRWLCAWATVHPRAMVIRAARSRLRRAFSRARGAPASTGRCGARKAENAKFSSAAWIAGVDRIDNANGFVIRSWMKAAPAHPAKVLRAELERAEDRAGPRAGRRARSIHTKLFRSTPARPPRNGWRRSACARAERSIA